MNSAKVGLPSEEISLSEQAANKKDQHKNFTKRLPEHPAVVRESRLKALESKLKDQEARILILEEENAILAERNEILWEQVDHIIRCLILIDEPMVGYYRDLVEEGAPEGGDEDTIISTWKGLLNCSRMWRKSHKDCHNKLYFKELASEDREPGKKYQEILGFLERSLIRGGKIPLTSIKRQFKLSDRQGKYLLGLVRQSSRLSVLNERDGRTWKAVIVWKRN